MTDLPPSPKRRRILSSMNPDGDGEKEKSVSSHQSPSDHPLPRPSPTEENRAQPTRPEGSETAPKPSKFRFKSKHSSRHRDADNDNERSSTSTRRRDHSHSRRHRHKRRRRCTPTPDPPRIPEDDGAGLSPDAAFRESLFDAMADDEGAAYWEGVYGQPIHVYPRDNRPREGEGGGPADGKTEGELERMTDEEYAAFVRRKMWEKTHTGLLEERARREEEKRRREAEREEGRRIAEEMETSLRRGEERRRRRVWRDGWERYVDAWRGWRGGVEGMPWPTRGGTREEVGVDGEVREFFEKGLDRDELGEKEFAARLKEERVRWHPDKVQQKLGGSVEEDVMKDVTAIFQIIDRLWNDTRPKV